MSSSLFPVAVDTFTNPTATSTTNSPSLSAGQTLQNDALAALETKVGITSSTDVTSLDFKSSGVITGWNKVLDTWAYSSYDSTNKTGVITVPSNATLTYQVGMRVKFTNNSSIQYGIITVVASTSLTVYFGTDYSLTNSAITLVFFSPWKIPLGFPIDPLKWTVQTVDTSSKTQLTPTGNTWYNQISLIVPIGSWKVASSGVLGVTNSGGNADVSRAGLSTANNTQGDVDMTATIYLSTLSAGGLATFYREKNFTIASATTYYLNLSSPVSVAGISLRGDLGSTVIKAVCAYL